MKRIDITLNLPEDLAKEAESAGLLTAERLEKLLASELDRQRRVGRFFGKINRLTNLEPKLTLDEIDDEIAAYRQEKRDKAD